MKNGMAFPSNFFGEMVDGKGTKREALELPLSLSTLPHLERKFNISFIPVFTPARLLHAVRKRGMFRRGR